MWSQNFIIWASPTPAIIYGQGRIQDFFRVGHKHWWVWSSDHADVKDEDDDYEAIAYGRSQQPTKPKSTPTPCWRQRRSRRQWQSQHRRKADYDDDVEDADADDDTTLIPTPTPSILCDFSTYYKTAPITWLKFAQISHLRIVLMFVHNVRCFVRPVLCKQAVRGAVAHDYMAFCSKLGRPNQFDGHRVLSLRWWP